jgi:hypothetical protein
MRQLNEPWGNRTDKDDQLGVPLPDAPQWKRVRYWGVDHFTGFRYGDDYHAVAVVFVQDVSPDVNAATSEACMRRFESWGRRELKNREVKLGPIRTKESSWRSKPLVIHSLDGAFLIGLSRKDFSAAWAAYPAYPHACLIYGMAVPWSEHEPLAKRVRDRWIEQGFVGLSPFTPERPYRK